MAGIKQGCPLSPYLIVLLMDAIFSVGKKEPCQRTKRQPICRSPLWGRSVIVALHESASSRNRWTFKEFFCLNYDKCLNTCVYIYMPTPPPPYLPFCVFSAKKSHTGVLCMYAAPVPTFSRLCMLLGISFRHLGCKEYCTMWVPVSRCHLRNCVCCVMVLPVFVTYVPESALFTVDRATADVHETLVHAAYMHICGRGSGVTCLRRRDLLRLKSQHCRLNTDQGVKVITRTTTISSSFD